MVTSFSHGKTEGNRVRLAILPTAQMGADPTYVYLYVTLETKLPIL